MVVLVLGGVASLALGLVIGLVEHGMCGSAFFPDSSVAELYDSMSGYYGGSAVADCPENLASAKMFGWLFLILGIVLLLAAILLRATGNRTQIDSGQSIEKRASAASRLAELRELQANNMIGPEEYARKREQIIRGL